MFNYESPDFDITVFEIEDIVTVSIGDGSGGGGSVDWGDIKGRAWYE